MAYNPVSGAAIQYSKSNGQVADGYYLKFYVANTTTPLSMATDVTGDVLLAKCKLNDKGYPITNPLDNETVFIPYVNQSYRFVLYQNETDADNNDTASADANIADVPTLLASDSGIVTPVESVENLFGLVGVEGQQVSVGEYNANTNVGNFKAKYRTDLARTNHDGVRYHSPARDLATEGLSAYLTASTDADLGVWENTEDQLFVEMAGALFDGTDAHDSFIAALSTLEPVFGLPVTYSTDQIDWANGYRFIGSGTWSAVQQTDKETGTTVLKYIGLGGANSGVVNFSKAAIGTDPNGLPASDRTLMNATILNVVIDGNDLAEYGIYMARAWSNNTIDNIAVTATLAHGFWAGRCFNGSPKNWFTFKNSGAGITLGADTFGWGDAPVDQSVCSNFLNSFSGYNSALVAQNVFDETTNKDKEYGIGTFDCRGLTMIDAQSLHSGGAGIYVSPSLYPVTFIGGYAEDAGESSNNASGKSWCIWIESTADSRNIEFDGTHLGLTPAIRLSGVQPSRQEAAVKFTRLPLISEIDADWDRYYLEDCARGITFSGTLPANNLCVYNSALTIKDFGVQAHGSFNATTGAIVEDESIACSIAYTGVGIYTVTFDAPIDNAFYSVDCSPSASNRSVFISNKASTGFRINHESYSLVLTDSGSNLQFTVFGMTTV